MCSVSYSKVLCLTLVIWCCIQPSLVLKVMGWWQVMEVAHMDTQNTHTGKPMLRQRSSAPHCVKRENLVTMLDADRGMTKEWKRVGLISQPPIHLQTVTFVSIEEISWILLPIFDLWISHLSPPWSVAGSATYSLVDKTTGEHVGQTLIDFLPDGKWACP